jgi:uncharacterized protein with GYD domain
MVQPIRRCRRGVRSYAVDRAEAAKALAAKFGGGLREIYWTVGLYDIVAITEASDDESATAFALSLAAQGNVRTTNVLHL